MVNKNISNCRCGSEAMRACVGNHIWWFCPSRKCAIVGPRGDHDGAKWNALMAGTALQTPENGGTVNVRPGHVDKGGQNREPPGLRPPAPKAHAANPAQADTKIADRATLERVIDEIFEEIGVTDNESALQAIADLKARTKGADQARAQGFREGLEAAAEIAEALIKNAYNAGFNEGIREHMTTHGGIPWCDSEQKKQGASAIRALIPADAPDELAALRAEIERLREALRALHDSYVKVCPFANVVAQQARAALAQKEG